MLTDPNLYLRVKAYAKRRAYKNALFSQAYNMSPAKLADTLYGLDFTLGTIPKARTFTGRQPPMTNTPASCICEYYGDEQDMRRSLNINCLVHGTPLENELNARMAGALQAARDNQKEADAKIAEAFLAPDEIDLIGAQRNDTCVLIAKAIRSL